MASRGGWSSKRILSARLEPIYFDCVLAEAVSTVARRLREKRRSADLTRFLNRIVADFQPEVITWILPDVPRLYVPALEAVQSSGGELNFNDALIALACRASVWSRLSRALIMISTVSRGWSEWLLLKTLRLSPDLGHEHRLSLSSTAVRPGDNVWCCIGAAVHELNPDRDVQWIQLVLSALGGAL